MSIPSSPGAVPTRDYTVQTYFPNNDQKFEVPQGSTLSGQWFQNLTFRNEFRAPSPLNNSSSALDCAIEASVTSRLIYELPTSSTGSAPHNTSDIPVKSVASFVQYIPDLTSQYLQHYETSILTNDRRATLTATTASSPQLIRFLAQHSELDQELFLGKDEAYYNSFLENMLKVSGLLAEVVDNSVCQGLRGWQIMKESQAFNVKMDLVVQNKGRGRVSLEVKQLKAGEKVLQAIEELSPVEGENVELGDGSETAQAALRKMAIHMEERKCEIGIITDLGSAMVFKLHKSEGATRSILLRSDRFYFYSQTVSLIRLVASLILTPDETELIIDGVRDIPAGGSPGFTRSGASYQSPPKNPIATTPARRCQRVAPFTPCQSAGRKAAFEEEFGLGGVRVVGEGVTEDGRHSFVEIETGEGPLILYGEEKKWLEGRNLIPTAGKFKSENLLEAQHLTLINDFAVFTPTNLRQLTRMQLSHGQLTPPTTPPQPTPPLLVLALSSTIFQNNNCTVYATTIKDLKLVVKKLSKDQKELANQEAMMNTFGFRNLSADFVPKLFGFFTDEEGDFYLVFEYAGKASKFSELSFSESFNLYSNLKTLHAQGILHGDFEDRNIVVGSGETDRRTVKIIDFGFSQMHECEGDECWELREARFLLGLSQEILCNQSFHYNSYPVRTPHFIQPSSSQSERHSCQYIASFVQYIPDLASQYLDHYKTSILTNARRATLSTITSASSRLLSRFLIPYEVLNEPKDLPSDESNYTNFMVKVCEMACSLAEVIDPAVVKLRRNGSEVVTEDRALNMKMDVVLKFRGERVVSLEAKGVKAGERVLREIEECSPDDQENIELDSTPSAARDALRKMALYLHVHKCKFGILTNCASAIIFRLHKPEGSTRSILLRSDRFSFFSQTTPLILLIASALLSHDEPELFIKGVRDIPAAFFPSKSNRVLSSATSPSAKLPLESEFGIGGVRVVGEGITEDGRHSFVELETAEGRLTLYGEEKKWLEGRELIPIAGKFSAEALLEAQHLTIINNFAIFTPTNQQHLTRTTLSHAQPTSPTTPPKTTPPSLVLALSSTISQTDNSTIYATTIEGLELVVKELLKAQEELAIQEAMMNTFGFRNLSADVVPKFFGIFTNEEGNFDLVFEYAGKASKFSELSASESSNLYLNLKTLHAQGILHGDFDERNVVVGSGERDSRSIKIIDFGLSQMHQCEGEDCWELKGARDQLGISEEM